MSQQIPRASSSHNAQLPVVTGGRGIKGFFSRTKTMSPEPAALPTSRSRIRSFMNDTAKVGTSSRPTPGDLRTGQRTLSSEVTIDRQRLENGAGREAPARPTTPTERTRRQIRFNPSALPAMQKGNDGRWQPPSLSRGSMSTSALATLAQDDDGIRTARPSEEEKFVRGHKHTLSDLFQSTARHKPPPIITPARKQLTENDKTIKPTSRTDNTQFPVNPSGTAIRSSGKTTTIKASPLRIAVEPKRPTHMIPLSPKPVSHPPLQQSRSDPVRPATNQPVNPPPLPRSDSSDAMPPPPIPSHARQDSSSPSTLSREHYLLRLSTSFIVKMLTPVIKGASFVQSDKNVEMRRIVDERLTALARMEKAWGSDWAKAGNALTSTSESKDPASGWSEGEIRLVHVGERAKERERKGWIEALKDGILLCFLLNHLFPSQPSHIVRLNVTEDGILRSTNLTRFITACQTIGVLNSDLFSLTDLQEGTEVSIGRVAQTIVALARLAGGTNSGSHQAKLPNSSRPGSRNTSRPPSRNTTAVGTPARSPPVSPRRTSVDLSPSKRTFPDKSLSSPNGSPIALKMDSHGSNDRQNDLHSKLLIVTGTDSAATIIDPAYKTPTTSTFASPPASNPPIKRTPLPRASTQPNISPIRAKSPSSPPSSRSITSVENTGNLQIRPSLRPRNTTEPRTAVSFANKASTSPRVDDLSNSPGRPASHSHSRERTPSLISAGSRVTSSAYSRSSAAYSVATILGGDHGNAIDLTEDAEDGLHRLQNRERRASEQKLQEARQRIIGTLLSSDDLPDDLKRAVRDSGLCGDEARNSALSDSLATLEGNKADPQPRRLDSSPGQRPLARRGMSIEIGRPDANKVPEEDEASSNGTSVGAFIGGSRPTALQRLSSNGKIYVPKRSSSPASNLASPTGVTFPTSTSSYMIRTTSLQTYQPHTSTDDSRMDSKAERRQSDGYPRPKAHGREISESTENSSRPLQIRINSMVNLPVSGMERSPSLYRENSFAGGIRPTQSLQVLEFREAGCPDVKYQLGNCIGRGQFGSVYRSLNLSTGQMVAIKRIRLHGMREDEVTDVMKEVDLLKRLSHPSIVKYEGMSRDEEFLNIVLEFVENGSLGQTLKSFGNFNERLVSSYVAKILEGLDYLHSQGVVHCDLKAANILSTKNGNVKLSDFGVSLNMKAVENIKQDAKTAGREGGKKRVSEVAGTPNWMAPEVISLAGASFASDIWSLGCTIIELLTGKPPYSDITNSMTVLFRIVEDEMPPIPDGISDALIDFLKLCFIKDPSARPPAMMLFEHPWVKGLHPILALRPQDSVPFLRRVSMDLHRVDSQRIFEQGNLSPKPDNAIDGRKHRHSMASSHGREGSGSGKNHVLVKTSFGKAIPCRVCMVDVKKQGVLCQDCGLIAHTSCASKASPRCDIHEQLALFAKQQEISHSLSPPRVASPQPSFEDRDGSPFTALPGKILNGIIRSKSRGGLVNSSNLSHIDLSSSETNKKGIYGHGYNNQSRPSLDQQQPSSRSTSFNLQNRSSLYSNMTEYDNDQNEAKRRSGVHFELGDQRPPPQPPAMRYSLENDGNQSIPFELTAENLASVGNTNRKGYTKNRESKSDCCIQ
ncbi:uncharacterized protein I206_100384 [Kwoniella pini CBS 10737]|uniref:STE/STE11/CDC15 protein kinase n=1 Tax=Kwoniella pini CBS 10737 TaxID=1296096 RepID=A0A1B9IDY8_9TREE|nr:STE/STE11/CDC15 protein kinase [Kwoniella pini CBS 10737]OCF53634.1 STE/STE11/CDC15 protein kinase [Kwoniella pini CBS 10737]